MSDAGDPKHLDRGAGSRPDGIAAGSLADWAESTVAGGDADLPCGACTACCTASQFIHIRPQETATIDAIPSDLLFPAPGLPPGNLVMGHDQFGHCPMLTGGACSIYEQRPVTCRTYDCRVFAATGSEPDDAGIAEQARRWRFSTTSPADRERQDAVHRATEYLFEHADSLADDLVPTRSTQRAALAVGIHETFLIRSDTPRPLPTPEEVAAAIRRVRSRH